VEHQKLKVDLTKQKEQNVKRKEYLGALSVLCLSSIKTVSKAEALDLAQSAFQEKFEAALYDPQDLESKLGLTDPNDPTGTNQFGNHTLASKIKSGDLSKYTIIKLADGTTYQGQKLLDIPHGFGR